LASCETFINPFSGKPIAHPTSGGAASFTCRKDVFTTTSNGENQFTLSAIPKTASVMLSRNGQILSEGVGEDYQISGQVITLETEVSETIRPGEKILAQYIESS